MQLRKAYLSIDLDYWQNEKTDRACRRFFERVFSLGLPITVVDSHERMLQDVNGSKANVLYHVDYHSDLTGYCSQLEAELEAKRKPDDGTWINHVRWRRTGEVYWFYPSGKCYGTGQLYSTPMGRERGYGVCWRNAEENPFYKTTYNEWGQVHRSRGCADIDWSIVSGVGVALSADYLVRTFPVFSSMKKDLYKNVKPFDWAVSKLEVRQRLIDSFANHTQGSKWITVVNVGKKGSDDANPN